ncbi:MAG: TOMM precursor leader peptide-binding protein [Bryobacterales bacterium]
MSARLRFDTKVYAIDEDSVALIGEHHERLISGPAVSKALTTLQTDLPGVSPEIQTLLEKEDLLRPETTADPVSAGYWDSLGIDANEANRHLSNMPVEVRSLVDGLDAGPLSQVLASCAGQRDNPTSSLLAVAVNDYLDPRLQEISGQRRQARKPWFLFRPIGRILLMGPFFELPESVCLECLAWRFRENRWLATQIWGLEHAPSRPRFFTPASVSAGSGLAVNLIANFLAGSTNNRLANEILSIDLLTLATERHSIWPRQDCPRCSQVSGPLDVKVALERSVSPLTGIVSDVNVAESQWAQGFFVGYGKGNIPVVPERGGGRLAACPRRVSGRGWTAEQARMGCISEAVERYSSGFQGSEPLITATLDELGDAAIHPSSLLPYSEAQASQWRSEKAGEGSFARESLDANRPIQWAKVQHLPGERSRYVAASWAYLDYGVANDAGHYAPGHSNGCAAGSSFEDAASRAFLELVERDSMALWWLNQARRPAIPTEKVGDAALNEIERSLAKARRRIHYLDLTSDLAIPVIAAVLTFQDRPGVLVGMGCDLTIPRAMQKAAEEVLQLDTLTACLPPEEAIAYASEVWAHYVTADDHDYFMPSDEAAKLSSVAPEEPASERLDAITQAISKAGLECYALDLTRSQLGVPVVRAVVPGLRPFLRALGPGRLYSTPVKLGWLKKPRLEEQMNPFEFPF